MEKGCKDYLYIIIDMTDNYCNNCGKHGHNYNQCKLPITSFGSIAFRINNNNIEYLMIRRKDTLGFIDFMRGKYSVTNKEYIMNMIKQMTDYEKNKLTNISFDENWSEIWGNISISNQYKNEENTSKVKFNQLKNGIQYKGTVFSLNDLINESKLVANWEEPEWGFPKGRRNLNETDLNCALREFSEETGFNLNKLKILENIFPFEEIFTGSNYKSYKHRYFITYMDYKDTENINNYEKSEVSKMEWKTYEECISSIRYYNLEKQRMITNIHNMLLKYIVKFTI
jgi:8-oxo-dGTP pyrophosphatase MutT (NUDIX family)